MIDILNGALSILPVVVFLLTLTVMDSYKLVPRSLLTAALVYGAISALLALAINSYFLPGYTYGLQSYTRYLAPLIEETCKCGMLVWLLRTSRVGFLVDAAVYGFAIGTGFALVENLYYLTALESANPLLWIVRGFGTAVIHGGSMALFGITARHLMDRQRHSFGFVVLGGWIVAVCIHSVFNHFALPPVWNTLVVMVLLPVILYAAFRCSEEQTRNWLGQGMDLDLALLESLSSDDLPSTPVGQFLTAIRDHFAPEVMVDMFCYLRLYAELSISAKGTLMLKESGVTLERDEEIIAKLEELKTLESNIGPTGKLALGPFLHNTTRDLWQLHVVGR
jgi:protease PrsW